MRFFLPSVLLVVLSLYSLPCSVTADQVFSLVSSINISVRVNSFAVTSTSLYYLPGTFSWGPLLLVSNLTGVALPTINVSSSVAGQGLKTPLQLTWVRTDSSGVLHVVDIQNDAILKLKGDGSFISAVRVTQFLSLIDNFDVSPDGLALLHRPLHLPHRH